MVVAQPLVREVKRIASMRGALLGSGGEGSPLVCNSQVRPPFLVRAILP